MGLCPRVKSALLWGGVGFMSFLVLLQGYALYDGPLLSLAHGVAVAIPVGLGAAIGAYVLEHRIAAWTARRHARRSEGSDESKS